MAKILANPTGAVFRRHEKKYMLSPEQYTRLTDALRPYMEQDQYGLHTICSVYYDTDSYDLIRRSLDKPAFKQKFRLRTYGVPGEGDKVYLELKKKLDGITYKRRIAVPLCAARDYLERGVPPTGVNPQNWGEIDWFLRQIRPVPKVLLCYDRIALFGRHDPSFRITFDANIRWRSTDPDPSHGDYGSLLLAPGMRVMEIKTLEALPMWLCGILSKLEIYPCSFSKYGTVYQTHLINGGKEELRHAG